MYTLRIILVSLFILLSIGCKTISPINCNLSKVELSLLQQNLDKYFDKNPAENRVREMISGDSYVSPERRRFCEIAWHSEPSDEILDGFGHIRFDRNSLDIVEVLCWDHYL